MPASAKDIYEGPVSHLSPAERLRLASLILEGLSPVEPPPGLVMQDDTWSAQDQVDVAAYSLDYAAALYPEDEDLV